MEEEFREHPDSVVGRLRKTANAKRARRRETLPDSGGNKGPDDFNDWFDLTLDSTEEEFMAVAGPILDRAKRDAAQRQSISYSPVTKEKLESCPLDPLWTTWPFQAWIMVPTESEEVCAAATRVSPVRHLGRIDLQWSRAFDEPRSDMESCQHLHCETEIRGRRVHIGHISAERFGIERAWRDLRVFVDSELAGHGLRFGTPLGGGRGQRGPTVALVTNVEAITVDTFGRELVVELWKWPTTMSMTLPGR